MNLTKFFFVLPDTALLFINCVSSVCEICLFKSGVGVRVDAPSFGVDGSVNDVAGVVVDDAIDDAIELAAAVGLFH